MNSITWLMDVDGVLNDFRDLSNPAYSVFEAENGFLIAYDETLLKRIIDLHVSKTVTVKWLTTWCHEANHYLRERLGFPEDLEVIGKYWYDAEHRSHYRNVEDLPNSPYLWWKSAAAEQYIEEHPDEDIIWTDDDMVYYTKEVKNVTSKAKRSFALSPLNYNANALNHTILDSIEEWINK